MARDERFGMGIFIKDKAYRLLSWYTTIDVEKKKLLCHARLPEGAVKIAGSELASVSFFIPIEFEKTTEENPARIGSDRIKEEHIYGSSKLPPRGTGLAG